MSESLEIARKNMVINQLRPNKIKEEHILNLFEITPKENFLDNNQNYNCYLDKDLDIIKNRGYLKNLHLAQLIKYAEISKDYKVLHLGGLTGYFSVILSSLCNELYVVEENEDLYKQLKNNIKKIKNSNIKIFNSKLTEGHKVEAPYDLVIIDCPLFKLEENLKNQIKTEGGKLIYIKKINENLSKAYKVIRNDMLFSTEYLFDLMTKYQIKEKEEVFNF